LLGEARARGDRYAVTGLVLLTYSYVAHLVRGEAAGARDSITDAVTEWSQKGFHLQHFWAFYGQAEADLYEGSGLAAWDRVQATWPALTASLLLRVQTLRISAYHLRARSALAAASERRAESPGLYKDLCGHAHKLARRIEQENVPWAEAISHLLRGLTCIARHHRQQAIEHFEAAETSFESLSMKQYAAAARWRRGQLLESSSGQMLIDRSRNDLMAEGAVTPESLVNLFAPLPGGLSE
jgi:eukaryotic-like serine/threonine-protein kinase